MAKTTRRQVVGAAIVLMAAAAFLVTPFQTESSGSAAFPRAVSVFLAAFGLLIVLLPGKGREKDPVRLLDPQLLLYMALVLGAVVMIQVVGFYAVIPVAVALCLLIFGERNLKAIIPFALIVTAAIYLVIDCLLGSPLP
ncbi:MAG: tripartite tricarboxylate transporter TctB family protein [Desulfovibrionaceae bacterium]|jgi:peptidoglycan/LPS O-acetylase OafA/YrhL|nr:tripartite tricarboxylate transporter TctB family protein [Desulfovibrionaceae bacterium]